MSGEVAAWPTLNVTCMVNCVFVCVDVRKRVSVCEPACIGDTCIETPFSSIPTTPSPPPPPFELCAYLEGAREVLVHVARHGHARPQQVAVALHGGLLERRRLEPGADARALVRHLGRAARGHRDQERVVRGVEGLLVRLLGVAAGQGRHGERQLQRVGHATPDGGAVLVGGGGEVNRVLRHDVERRAGDALELLCQVGGRNAAEFCKCKEKDERDALATETASWLYALVFGSTYRLAVDHVSYVGPGTKAVQRAFRHEQMLFCASHCAHS